jgi:hypothetical protein
MNPLYPAFITGAVAIIIFVINHIITFCVNYHNKKKTKIENKLKALYSPLYLQIRVQSMSDSRFDLEAVTLDTRRPGFGLEEIDKLLNENAIYASNELIEKWMEFVLYRFSKGTGHNFAIIVVKEYNELRKKLKLEYDEIELATGFPKETMSYDIYQANNVS